MNNNKIWVYLFEGISGLSEGFIAEKSPELPFFRRRQCESYRQSDDKKACIVSYMLLKTGLLEQYGITDPGEFVYNRHGKPYLREHPHIFFNISHCKTGAACALSYTETGVDIQDIRPFDIETARRVCGKNELDLLAGSGAPAKLFCEMWAKKESRAKAEGISVCELLNRDLPDGLFYCRETENYFMALCCKNIDLSENFTKYIFIKTIKVI